MVRKRKTKSETRSQVCKDVDFISDLSDDLLVKILSRLPTKVAVSTSILSKRWECVWMLLPKLKYHSTRSVSACKRLQRFLDLNLPLHRAPVIESFHLHLDDISLFNPRDIKLWLVIALSRCLRKLKITSRYFQKRNILPSSLYVCKTLVVLKLCGMICVDVPRLGCLPSLKTLQLQLDYYLGGKTLARLLSICPVLEDLELYCDTENDEDVGLFTVTVPSLQRLSFTILSETGDVLDGLVIDTPSLKYLKLEDLLQSYRPSFSVETMPYLEEAYVDLRYWDFRRPLGSVRPIDRVMRSITSVKRLTICIGYLYGDGLVFNQLEYLKICGCTASEEKWDRLARLIEDSPNLRVLDIFEMEHYVYHGDEPPTTVDEIILSGLEDFDWSRYYERRPHGMDLAVYILGKKWSPEDCNNLV